MCFNLVFQAFVVPLWLCRSYGRAVVEAAIEQDQAAVAGIRGDAAERPTPTGKDGRGLGERGK